MRTALLSSLLGLLAAPAAHAGLFEPVRSTDPLPAREVERSLVLPMGWTQLTTSFRRRSAYERRLDQLELDLAHGISRRIEGRLTLDHRTHRTDPDVAGDKRTTGLAGATFGLRGIVAQRAIGGSWLAWEASTRAPFGDDHPGTRVQLPISGPPRAALALIGRQRSGALRVDVGAQGVVDLPGAVGSGPLARSCGGRPMEAPTAWLGVGGAFEFWGAGLVQAGPLVVGTRFDGALWTGREVRARRAADGDTCPSRVRGGADQVVFGGQVAVLSPLAGLQLSRGLTARGWLELRLAGSEDAVWVERAAGRAAGVALEGSF